MLVALCTCQLQSAKSRMSSCHWMDEACLTHPRPTPVGATQGPVFSALWLWSVWLFGGGSFQLSVALGWKIEKDDEALENLRWWEGGDEGRQSKMGMELWEIVSRIL